MPITLNVGLSRKLSKDYNSNGASINLDVELPGDVLNDPASLEASAQDLFALCETLLDQQLAASDDSVEVRRPATRSGGRRSPRTNGDAGRTRGLTQAQSRAISNMARKLGEDADTYAQHEFGCVVDDLSVRQASEFIDVLKNEIESKQGVSR